MAASMNKVFLIGRLGKDPKLSYTQSGIAVANFSLATDESYKDKSGQKVEKAEWHNVVAWNQLAEFCSNFLSKGRLVLVEGKLQTRKWTDQNNVERYTTEILATRINFLDSMKDQDQAGQQDSQQQQRQPQQRQGQNSQGGQQRQPQPQQQQRQRQNQQQPQYPTQSHGPEEDLGPVFLTEASGMDDVPF